MGILKSTTAIAEWDDEEQRFTGVVDLNGNVHRFGPPFAGTFPIASLPTPTLVGTEAVAIRVDGLRQLMYWNGVAWINRF